MVDKPLVPCSAVSREAAALAQLKSLLKGAGISAGLELFTWITGTNYCGGLWVGVTCEAPNTVTVLNLSALSVKVQAQAILPLLDVVAAISNLTQLQTLVLAGIGLSGPVHEPSRPGLDSFTKLRHLDISGNPGLSSDLPNSWFAMRGLTTLDISATGIGGTLPEDYAAFQELREFRAVDCPGITGRLPPAWGLLKLGVLEITNAALTGGLPPEWADAAAQQKAAAALAASLEARAASAVAVPASAASEAEAEQNGTDSVAAQPVVLGMQRLRVLDLSVAGPGRGGLSGALPAAFAQLEQLQVLVLSGHNFSGSLPPAWTRLSQLRVLDVSRNSLTGSLPKWYASMLQLAVLKVHDNQLVPAASGSSEFFEYLVGDGLKLQCLCVANNSGVLLDAAKAVELKRRAQASSPPAQLVIDEPTDRLCDAQAWK
uniref:Uncharacterized protein n=1 Tax=Tetradesmus obliquus TaxID=3088 RepID=A0A383W896_TETOB|eukprot:jgi/Sobl393_1/4886/SZX73848.1